MQRKTKSNVEHLAYPFRYSDHSSVIVQNSNFEQERRRKMYATFPIEISVTCVSTQCSLLVIFL